MHERLKKLCEGRWLEGHPDRDHSLGLVIFGTLEVLLGILAFSLAMFLMVLVSAAGLGALKTSHLGLVMGFLFGLTGWFIALGLGSMKATRWARALMLVGAWITLFLGALGMALLLYMLPGMLDLLTDSGLFAPSVALAILYAFLVVLFFLQLILPIAAIVFYSMQGVRSTCERLNPSPCWTDRCPLPLMAMGFISVLGSLSVFLGITTNFTVLLFGRILTGWQGFPLVLLVSGLCGYIGWGAFTRKIHAWWLAYALILAVSASMMLSFSELDMFMLYQALGYANEQIMRLSRFSLLNPAAMTFVSCIWGIMACIYLVWVRDCFIPEQEEAEIKSYRQRRAEEEAARVPEPDRPRMRLED